LERGQRFVRYIAFVDMSQVKLFTCDSKTPLNKGFQEMSQVSQVKLIKNYTQNISIQIFI